MEKQDANEINQLHRLNVTLSVEAVLTTELQILGGW